MLHHIERTEKGNNMDEALKAKLDEARERMNSQQAGINADRKREDRATREWARGKQRPANAERALFRNSLTDEDRRQIEERIQQLLDDNPALSVVSHERSDTRLEDRAALCLSRNSNIPRKVPSSFSSWSPCS